MKKILFTFLLLLLLFTSAQATSLKGGIYEEYIPNAFYGTWGVISKLKSSNDYSMFNKESRDIWTLSGHSNILILQNLDSGAYSEIIIKDKNKDGKTLKFQREKNVKENDIKIKYKETVSFILSGKKFSGTDNFIVEKYNKNNILIDRNEALYLIEGVKIPN